MRLSNTTSTVNMRILENTIADDRKIQTYILIGSTAIDMSCIQRVELDENINSSDTMVFGSVCSSKLTINLINAPTTISYDNALTRLQFRVYRTATAYDTVNAGWYHITEIEPGEKYTDGDNTFYKTLRLIAYDGISKLTGTYACSLSGNQTISAMYNNLLTAVKDNTKTTLQTYSNSTIITIPDEFNVTYQQALSYIAGCTDSFVVSRYNFQNQLQIKKYTDTGITIPLSQQYMGGLKLLTENPLTITSVVSGTSDNTIVAGDGTVGTCINYENPLITQELVDAIYATYNGVNYTPMELKYRGNIALQAGDIVTVPDKYGVNHTVYIMRHKMIFDGGFYAVIECKGKSLQESNFSSNFQTTSQKIQTYYNASLNAIKHATEQITGNKGGYVVFHDGDGDGYPDEILIMNTPDIATATQVWRWNASGLGYATNYGGPYKTAITADGQINADMITTGTINASVLNIGGDFLTIDSLNTELNNKGYATTSYVDDELSDYAKKEDISDTATAIDTGNGYRITREGFFVDNAYSKISTKINYDGMVIANGGDYDNPLLRVSSKGVEAENVHSRTYLIIGNNCRFEDYESNRTACYYIGD